jgi:hypothetical protein
MGVVNRRHAVFPALGGLFAAVFTAFLTSVLNPQMAVTTEDHFRMLGWFLLGVGLPAAAVLTLFNAAADRPGFLAFFGLCTLVVACLPLERALHPLFLHPTLVKILFKGGYAGVVLLLGFLLLRRHPLLILLLIGAGSVFLYHRRDAFRPPAGAAFSGEARGAVPTRIILLVFDGYPADAFWEDLKRGALPRVEVLARDGVTATFAVHSYFPPAARLTTLFSGAWPYQHRVFGSRSNVLLPVRGADRFPFFFPPLLDRPASPAVSMVWDMLTSRGISCGIVDCPVFDPARSAVTCHRADGDTPAPAEIYATPVSFLLRHQDLPAPPAPLLERELERARAALRPGDTLGVLGLPAGVLVMAGPGLRPGARATSMKPVDLVPTLAYLFQVPLSAEMPGRILLEAFDPAWISEHPMGVVGRY